MIHLHTFVHCAIVCKWIIRVYECVCVWHRWAR